MKNMTIPADIARQTLFQLAKNSLPPTPENYAATYKEIAGAKAFDAPSVNKTLQKVLVDASKKYPQFIDIENAINKAVKKQDWPGLETQFQKLFIENMNNSSSSEVNWSTLIRNLLKQLETSHKGITLSRKKEGLSRVLTNFSKDQSLLAEKVQALVRSWGDIGVTSDMPSPGDHASTHQEVQNQLVLTDKTSSPIFNTTQNDDAYLQLREMMLRTLDLAIIPLLKDAPEPHQNAQNLRQQLSSKPAEVVLVKSSNDLRGILLSAETELEDKQSINQALVNLLRLLAKNLTELIIDNQCFKVNIGIVNDVLNNPINLTSLQNAESSLKELIHKQSNLRPAALNAQELLKQMATTFIARLVDISESTEDYHHKIEIHQKKLSNINSIDELNGVLKSVLDDTRSIGLTVQRTREEFKNSQTKVNEAEKKIQELSSVLEHINTVANEDYLTGTLNRRGMEDALEREFSRADRHNTALSIAMMDIDHFKKLNDQLGHGPGDQALAHFANVIKTVKRTTDVLARYGGEEFIIILPNTEQSDAIKVIERVQRKLTKQFFMHSNQHFVITFSAGVAQRLSGELPDAIIPRADAALYEAKNSGRNRVVGAPINETEPIDTTTVITSPKPLIEYTRH